VDWSDHFWALVNWVMRKVGCNFMWWSSCVDMCCMLHLSTDKYILPWGQRQDITPKWRQFCTTIAPCHIPDGCAVHRHCPIWRVAPDVSKHCIAVICRVKWSLKRQKLLTQWHSVTSHKTWICSTAVRPCSLIWLPLSRVQFVYIMFGS